jgi:hypothetical protein
LAKDIAMNVLNLLVERFLTTGQNQIAATFANLVTLSNKPVRLLGHSVSGVLLFNDNDLTTPLQITYFETGLFNTGAFINNVLQATLITGTTYGNIPIDTWIQNNNPDLNFKPLSIDINGGYNIGFSFKSYFPALLAPGGRIQFTYRLYWEETK